MPCVVGSKRCLQNTSTAWVPNFVRSVVVIVINFNFLCFECEIFNGSKSERLFWKVGHPYRKRKNADSAAFDWYCWPRTRYFHPQGSTAVRDEKRFSHNTLHTFWMTKRVASIFSRSSALCHTAKRASLQTPASRLNAVASTIWSSTQSKAGIFSSVGAFYVPNMGVACQIWESFVRYGRDVYTL